MAAITAHESDTGEIHHGSDAQYWKVFAALFALTALEVSTYWWPEEWHKVTHVLLIIMMIVKFVAVAFYFMHLKNDSVVLRRLFFSGLVLAVGVYIAGLTAMNYLDDSGTAYFNDPPRQKPLPPPPTDPPPIIRDTGGGH